MMILTLGLIIEGEIFLVLSLTLSLRWSFIYRTNSAFSRAELSFSFSFFFFFFFSLSLSLATTTTTTTFLPLSLFVRSSRVLTSFFSLYLLLVFTDHC
jgi:hypothetical protein